MVVPANVIRAVLCLTRFRRIIDKVLSCFQFIYATFLGRAVAFILEYMSRLLPLYWAVLDSAKLIGVTFEFLTFTFEFLVFVVWAIRKITSGREPRGREISLTGIAGLLVISYTLLCDAAVLEWCR